MTHVIVYSHGFGVRKDARGMFTQIAAALPECESVLFDYCEINARGQTVVTPLPDQAKKLQKVLEDTKQKYPDATIDLICHSQGCVAAGLAKPSGLRKIILLAPAPQVSAARMAASLTRLAGKPIDTSTTELQRRDGSVTELTPEYWQSLEGIDAIGLYNHLAEASSEVCIITANQDEVVSETEFTGLSPTICGLGIDGDHNFTGEARPQLITLIKKELLA